MSNEMKSESRAIPYSGQIIAAIVDALDIQDEVLTSRTAKRYYSGKIVKKDSLKQIYISLGERLEGLGIVPTLPLLKQWDMSMSDITAASIARLAVRWDSLCAFIQSRSGRIQDYSQAIESFSRLFVVDLALRIVSWLRLAKLPPPEQKTPQWAEENGGGKILRTLLSEAGITREQFGARVEVTRISIDNWFDGKIRPIPDHIESMAEAFTKLILGANKRNLQVQLQRQFTLAYLADILAEDKNIGRTAVIDLTAALFRFIWLISEDIEEMNRPPIEEAAGMEVNILRYGVDEPNSHTLLKNLALVEKDPMWRKEILSAITSWNLRFQEIAAQSSPLSASTGLAQELPEAARREAMNDETTEDLDRLKEACLLKPDDYAHIRSGDLGWLIKILNDGINDRRLIVKRHPLSPQAHMELGSFLGKVGEYLRNREMINEGINECKIAAALCEGWDTALVEPGIILINAGYFDEALVELEIAATKLPAMTPHLAMSRGYTLMRLERYEQALSDFEFVVKARPNYASALDHAAHCSFMIGDSKRGMVYAKEARKYGELQTYNDWRRGVYKKANLPKTPRII